VKIILLLNRDFLSLRLWLPTLFYATPYYQGRRQKNFRVGGPMEKPRPRNSTNKHPSTLSLAG